MEDSTQERELIAPDEPVTNDDTPMERPLPDDSNQNDIQDADIMPLQADDTSDAAMTMMRAEADSTDTNGDEPNDMLLFGGVALVVVLLVVLAVLILRKKPSAKETNSEENR